MSMKYYEFIRKSDRAQFSTTAPNFCLACAVFSLRPQDCKVIYCYDLKLSKEAE